jgi:hypothetical protein
VECNHVMDDYRQTVENGLQVRTGNGCRRNQTEW